MKAPAIAALAAVLLLLTSMTPWRTTSLHAQVFCQGIEVTIEGATEGPDILTGTPGNDVIQGLGGNDVIEGLGGDDLICGGDGDDIIEGGEGNDEIWGGIGNDDLDGDDGDDDLFGEDDEDTLRGGTGANSLNGGEGGEDFDLATYVTIHVELVISLAGESAIGTDINDMLVGIEHVKGGTENDSITGDEFDNVIEGQAGDDDLDGGDGEDEVNYFGADEPVFVDLAEGNATGEGADELASFENVVGSDEHGDRLLGDDLPNGLGGRGGDDFIDGRGEADAIRGQLGDDVLIGGPGEDRLFGGEGDNFLDGGSDDDRLEGGPQDDILIGGSEFDRAFGDEGFDICDAELQTDCESGEVHASPADVGASATAFVRPDEPHETGAEVTLTNHNEASTPAYTVVAPFEENILVIGTFALEGGFVFLAAVASDVADEAGATFYYKANLPSETEGDLSLYYLDGETWLPVLGSGGAAPVQNTADNQNSTVSGGSFSVSFDATSTPPIDGLRTLFAMGLLAEEPEEPLTCNGLEATYIDEPPVDFFPGTEGKDVILGLEGNDDLSGDDEEDTICGGDGDDVLAGGDQDDDLFGEDGNDELLGGGGNDELHGGPGDDQLRGDHGNDTLDGGTGIDEIRYTTSPSAVNIDLRDGIVSGGHGTDVLSEIEEVRGSNFNDFIGGSDIDDPENGTVDLLVGLEGDDVIDGRAGNDVLRGDDGNDTLLGGDGNDELRGGPDDDILIGGPGGDVLIGQDGIDICYDDGEDDIDPSCEIIAVEAEAGTAEDGEESEVEALPDEAGEAGVAAILFNPAGGSDITVVTVATFTENPTDVEVFDAGEAFIDLNVTGADDGTTINARFYYPSTVTGSAETDLRLLYFDGNEWVAVVGGGGEEPEKSTADNLDGTVSGGRFLVALDDTSTPAVTELTGTFFVIAGESAEIPTLYLRGTGATANPAVLFLNEDAPTLATAKYRDSAGINFKGGNPWKEAGAWTADSASGTFAAEEVVLWLGLKNSDDQGTSFDVKVDVYKDGSLIVSGLQRCITGVTRNPSLAKEVAVPLAAVDAGFEDETLQMQVWTRIGTNPNGTKCPGHNNATGLRTYFDATNRPARIE
jgi:Ca2+-binding RTX toxin-like protein